MNINTNILVPIKMFLVKSKSDEYIFTEIESYDAVMNISLLTIGIRIYPVYYFIHFYLYIFDYSLLFYDHLYCL